MTSLLSAISGQFARLIVLGTLFPVVIYSILNIVFVAPLLSPWGPALQNQLKKVAMGEGNWTVVALMFVVLVLTAILYHLNIPIVRLYEGYPWKDSWIGELFKHRKKDRLNKSKHMRTALHFLRHELRNRNTNDARISSLGSQQTRLARMLNSELPDKAEFILPTRLGNAIRSFERYSMLAYGMDAIVLWPRLIAKIDSAFASTIDDAKTSFDFMLNSSCLSTLTGLAVVVIGLASPEQLTLKSSIPWLWRAALFFALACVFYQSSIGRAVAWGVQVKSAFDLYRFELLKQLGHQQQPLSYFEEQALWRKVCSQMLYADRREAPVSYKDAPTRLILSPPDAQVIVTRTLGAASAPDGLVRVKIELKNDNPTRRSADMVMLVETVPDGFKYVWDSARVSTGDLRISSISPLQFVLSPLAPGAVVTVSYDMKPVP